MTPAHRRACDRACRRAYGTARRIHSGPFRPRMRAAQGRFALVIPPGQGAVARVAELIRLGDLVPIAQSREEGLTSLAQPPGS